MESSYFEKKLFEAIRRFKKYWHYNLIFFVILIGLFIYLTYKMDEASKKQKKEYPILRENDSLDVVVKDFFNNHGVCYLLTESSNKIRISNSGNYNYKPYTFLNFLNKGDTLYKSGLSDTLYIYRNSKKYYFVIGEFINKNNGR